MTETKTGWFNEVAPKFNAERFKKLTQTMSFPDYMELVKNRPQVTFSAYQRLYNMIVSKGISTHERYRKTVTHYKFFDDERIPICGLDETLESLVKHIKGAAGWYGTERRILLLHGPVGSSKSTICRLLKRGLEDYSRTDEGAIYTYSWKNIKEFDIKDTSPCPMNDDPMKLLPEDMRPGVVSFLNSRLEDLTPENQRHMMHPIRLVGELNPHCKYFMGELLKKYNGNWGKVVENHIEVRRVLLSESDRCGIGTFQPKDPKNQDATELTGDINYMKLGHYGVDSDPRAFSFDGEFEIANRGLLEFIEILKLEKEFLYDLLGVCQERQFKPKKFPQIDVDMVLIGHSVHPDTPVPHEYDGVLDVLPISEMKKLDVSKLKVFSVNVETAEVELQPVRSVFSHKFKGEWVVNRQDGGEITTTPNHSLFNKELKTFYPGEDRTSEIATFGIPEHLTLGKEVTKRWVEFFAEVEEEVLV